MSFGLKYWWRVLRVHSYIYIGRTLSQSCFTRLIHKMQLSSSRASYCTTDTVSKIGDIALQNFIAFHAT